MGSYSVLQNGSISIDLQLDIRDNGWITTDGLAVHSGCNAGLIKNNSIPTVAGQEYTVYYSLIERTSGVVRPIIGGTVGTDVTEVGSYSETLTATDDSGLKFYSDGNLKIGLINVSKGTISGVTLAFNEDNNKWVSYLSYQPEYMVKFLDKFITFISGTAWEHNINELRNNFYNEQFTSKITFYCNVSPTEVKNFYTLREKSNKVWEVTEAKIDPREGKSIGQRSRIKKGNFQSLQGDWFSSFLKDLNDPRFDTELKALLNGADLQGSVMEVTIENKDTIEVRLLSVDVEVSKQEYTY